MKVTSLQISNMKSFEIADLNHFGSVNLLVGKNNAGKSTILRALYAMQSGGELKPADVRLGADRVAIRIGFDELEHHLWTNGPNVGRSDVLTLGYSPQRGIGLQVRFAANGANIPTEIALQTEPWNVIYPYLSHRKVPSLDQQINEAASRAISADLRNLPAKVDELADDTHLKHGLFRQLVDEVINIPITAIASSGGKQVGIRATNSEWISVEEMGDGVIQMLGLIVQLCVAKNKIFLIEEIENDIHPEGLKALLRVIEAQASENQFFISTHSNIVVRHLGALDDSAIFHVENELESSDDRRMPTSRVSRYGNDVQSRTELLSSLGYELADMDLYDGWLVFEESSAEQLIRSYLVPWFAPRLSRLGTVATKGTSDLDRTFEALNKLILFSHLETRYKGRTFVFADNEPSGIQAVERLREAYSNWPRESFRLFSESDFEKYYPPRYSEQVKEVLALTNKKAKRDAKRNLLNQVLSWVIDEPDEARKEFEQSAAPVIASLRDVEAKLFQR